MAEFLHWVGDAFLLLIATLLGIAWNTKPSESRVVEIVDEKVGASAYGLKEYVADQIKSHRELMDEKLRRIEQGTRYSNRKLDRIEEILDKARGE